MLGLMKALPLLTEGRRLTPAQALSEGLVNELAATKDDMITRAEAWIAANPAAPQPWDRKGFALPGGDMFASANAGALAGGRQGGGLGKSGYVRVDPGGRR